jgi:hypothetical protein
MSVVYGKAPVKNRREYQEKGILPKISRQSFFPRPGKGGSTKEAAVQGGAELEFSALL